MCRQVVLDLRTKTAEGERHKDDVSPLPASACVPLCTQPFHLLRPVGAQCGSALGRAAAQRCLTATFSQVDRIAARSHEHELKVANLLRQIDEQKRTIDELQVDVPSQSMHPPRPIPSWL